MAVTGESKEEENHSPVNMTSYVFESNIFTKIEYYFLYSFRHSSDERPVHLLMSCTEKVVLNGVHSTMFVAVTLLKGGMLKTMVVLSLLISNFS